MTSLPNLPPNLDPTCISCGNVSALTAQLTTGLVGAAAQVQGTIVGQTAQLQSLVTQINAVSTVTRALIEAAISEDLINNLISQYMLPSGIANIKCVSDELMKINEQLNKKNQTTIDASQIPPITTSGLLGALLPTIEPPDIPSPAEIKGYIVELIERKKKEQQEAIVKLQREKAQADNISFV